MNDVIEPGTWDTILFIIKSLGLTVESLFF